MSAVLVTGYTELAVFFVNLTSSIIARHLLDVMVQGKIMEACDYTEILKPNKNEYTKYYITHDTLMHQD